MVAALTLLLLAAAPAPAAVPTPAAAPAIPPAAAPGLAPAGTAAAPAIGAGETPLPAAAAAPAGGKLTATATGMPAEPPEHLVLPGQAGDAFAAAVWPARPFQGGLVVVDVAGTDELKQVRGGFGKKSLRWHKLDRRSWRGLGPVPDDTAPGETTLTLDLTYAALPAKKGAKRQPARPREQRDWLLPVQAVDFDSDELRVDPRYTKVPPEAVAQIKADKLLMNAMWAKGSAPTPYFRKNFLKPREARTTAPYGTRRVFNGKQKSVHYGWDIDGKVGEPVLCANDGVVMLAEELYYSGGTMFIDHGAGLYSAFFHLSEFVAKEGERVKRGQLCAKVGKSGRVTGPHLHWGAKIGGSYVHPETLLLFDFEKPLVLPPAAPVAPQPAGAPLAAPPPR